MTSTIAHVSIERTAMATFLRGRGFTPEEMRERFKHFKNEFELYIRMAPETRLEEPSKKYAVMKGESYSAWETSEDASQYGYLNFGSEPFLIQKLTDENYDAVLAIFPEFRSIARQVQPKCTPSDNRSAVMDASHKSELV
jgi:hypothetical protein